MAMLKQIGAQLSYQRRLARLLGLKDSIRFRMAVFGAASEKDGRAMITLHPPTLSHPVEARIFSTDIDVYGQVLRQVEYEAVAVGQPRIIVDCGANVGYTSAYFLSRFPEATVIAIEPSPANAELCRRNLAPYGDRARVIEAGVWSSPGRLVIQGDGSNEWGIRVHRAGPGEAGDVEAIDIPSLGVPHIDILKIDIEGSEAELFGAAAERWLPKVRSIAIELHGPACERAFHKALEGYAFDEVTSGELTICLGLRPSTAADALPG